jgi:membrane protease subunit HflK
LTRPQQVIDAFRDVQAARADQERIQNEAQAYANRWFRKRAVKRPGFWKAANAYKRANHRRGDRSVAAFHENL